MDNDDYLESIFTDLRLIADVDVEREKAIFCVVGEKLRYSKGVIARIFSVLDKHDIGVSMISLGASEVNVTFVVDGRDVKKAAEVLHDEFFPEER